MQKEQEQKDYLLDSDLDFHNMINANIINHSWQATTLDGSNEFMTLGSLSQPIKSISYWIKPDTDDEAVMYFGGTNLAHIVRNSYFAGMTNQTTYVNGSSVTPLGSEAIVDEKSRIFSGAGTQRWTNLSFASFNTTNDLSLSSVLQYKFAYITYANAGVTIGKTYMVEFDCVLTSGAFQLKEQTTAGANQKVIANNVVNGHNAYVWTPAVPSGGVIGLLSMTTGTDTADFDNFTIKEVNKVTTSGVWNHVVVTSATAITAGEVTLGRGAGSVYYEGGLDDVAIWDEALTAGDVTTLYNGGKPNGVKGTSIDSDIAGYWRMGESEGGSVTTFYDVVGGNNLTSSNLESGDIASTDYY